MAIWGAIISGVISTGIKLLGSSGGPDYPSPPKLNKINIQQAKDFMQNYETERMGSSIAAWKEKFPLLYQGGQYMVNDLINNQKGRLSPNIKGDITRSGLEAPIEGDQLKMAKDIGLNPLTLSQRTSEAVTRQIAQNPEWSSQISGGTLATMIANNYQNQNAFSQFLGAQNTAQYVAGQTANANTTRALLTGLTGAARIGADYAAYNNPNNPFSLGNYYQGNVYGQSAPAFAPAGAGSGYVAPTYASNPPSVTVGPLEDANYNYAAPGQFGYSPAGAMSQDQYNNFYTDFYGGNTTAFNQSPYNPFGTGTY